MIQWIYSELLFIVYDVISHESSVALDVLDQTSSQLLHFYCVFVKARIQLHQQLIQVDMLLKQHETISMICLTNFNQEIYQTSPHF